MSENLKEKARILVVEDEKAIQLALSGLLRRQGYEVTLVDNGKEAIKLLEKTLFDLVLTDLALGSGPSGMDVLKKVRQLQPETAVVMITAYGSEKIAVEAMKAGAEDYIPKPFDNDEMRVVVARALERYRLHRENRLLLAQIQREYGFENLIGTAPEMRQIFETIKKIAETDLTVLICGESGTGKELVAQAIHNSGNRKKKPFVAVNCAAISRELVESELFGHEKGAFTGADRRRVGRFEYADAGTILLDEIGDMPIETQAKVLRSLQEQTIERVGSNQPVQVDVRVLAATNRVLVDEVQQGTFREDLFYRLNVIPIDLPPLRKRRNDIPLLAKHFLLGFAAEQGKSLEGFDSEVMRRLFSYGWPGNVRELENCIEHAAVLCKGAQITLSDMPSHVVEQPYDRSEGKAPADALINTIAQTEKEKLIDVLTRCGWNKMQASQKLGISRSSLYNKLKKNY